MKKIFIGVSFVFLILIGLHNYKFSIIPLWKVPKLLSSMRAKEFCTCYFLQAKGEAYCLESVLKGYPKFEFELDKDTKSVEFQNPVSSSKVHVVSKRLGCQLIE